MWVCVCTCTYLPSGMYASIMCEARFRLTFHLKHAGQALISSNTFWVHLPKASMWTDSHVKYNWPWFLILLLCHNSVKFNPHELQHVIVIFLLYIYLTLSVEKDRKHWRERPVRRNKGPSAGSRIMDVEVMLCALQPWGAPNCSSFFFFFFFLYCWQP